MKLEKKYRKRTEPFEFGELAKKTLDFPNQKIRLEESGKAYVQLEDGDELEVNYNLARFILFALKLRDKEIKINYWNIKSGTLKNLIMLSNCHRTMLVAMGFPFKEVLGNDFGSSIIDKFFVENGDLNLQSLRLDQINQVIKKKRKNSFPISLNFFAPTRADPNQVETFHSVLVLGVSKKGNVICFHKDGPGDNNVVELNNLENIIKDAEVKKNVTVTFVPMKRVVAMYNKIKHFALSNY